MISDDCNISRKAVRHAIKTLQEDRFIEVDEPFGAQQGHRITVCNYVTYQSNEADRGTEGNSEGNSEGNNAGNNAGNTNKNEKNGKNEENERTSTPQTPQGGQAEQENLTLSAEEKTPSPPPKPKPTDPRLQKLYRAYKPRSTVGPNDKERKSWKMVAAEFDPSEREIKELCEFVQEFKRSGRNGKAAFCHRDLHTALNNFGKFLACASDFHHHQKNRGEPDYSQVEDGGKW